MQSKTISTLALIAITLTGCATAAQRQSSMISNTTQQAGQELKACVAANYHNPKYAPIVPHVPAPENNFTPTMAQLADDTVPTKKESQLLIQYHDDGLPCRETALTRIGSVALAFSTALAESMVKSDAIIMQLAKRKTTWGHAMQQLQREMAEAQKKLLAASQQMNSGLQASHEAEMARRQAASDALMQWSIQQQLVNAANRPAAPTTTNCQKTVIGLSCTTW